MGANSPSAGLQAEDAMQRRATHETGSVPRVRVEHEPLLDVEVVWRDHVCSVDGLRAGRDLRARQSRGMLFGSGALSKSNNGFDDMTTARRARAVTLGDAPRARAARAKPSPVRSGGRAGLHASRLTPVDSRTGWQCAGRSDRLPSRSVERRDREPRRRPSWCTHSRAYRTGVSDKKGLGLRFVEAQARAQIVSAAAPLY